LNIAAAMRPRCAAATTRPRSAWLPRQHAVQPFPRALQRLFLNVEAVHDSARSDQLRQMNGIDAVADRAVNRDVAGRNALFHQAMRAA